MSLPAFLLLVIILESSHTATLCAILCHTVAGEVELVVDQRQKWQPIYPWQANPNLKPWIGTSLQIVVLSSSGLEFLN